MEGERWIPTFVGMTYRGVGMTYRVVGMTEASNEIAALSSKVMTGGLKLTIFTYKWGKCVRLRGNNFFKSLYSKTFNLHLK